MCSGKTTGRPCAPARPEIDTNFAGRCGICAITIIEHMMWDEVTQKSQASI